MIGSVQKFLDLELRLCSSDGLDTFCGGDMAPITGMFATLEECDVCSAGRPLSLSYPAESIITNYGVSTFDGDGIACELWTMFVKNVVEAVLGTLPAYYFCRRKLARPVSTNLPFRGCR